MGHASVTPQASLRREVTDQTPPVVLSHPQVVCCHAHHAALGPGGRGVTVRCLHACSLKNVV